MFSCLQLLVGVLALRFLLLLSEARCPDGSAITASVRENSPPGHLVLDLDVGGAVRLCLMGQNADWFYLEGRSLRLNTSASRVLDREVLGSVLNLQLSCSQRGLRQSYVTILVQIVDENDNRPNFLPGTVHPVRVSELAAVGSLAFTVEAVDADGDGIVYAIEESGPDAAFFRIDLPGSGRVLLDKQLDYETRPRLQLLIRAQEVTSAEKYSTVARVTVDVADGDDQYPHFLPCVRVSAAAPVCPSPTYSANVSAGWRGPVLDFSPGPIRAQDGDRGLDVPLVYSVLSGGDGGPFAVHPQTGDVTLTAPLDRRAATFRLTVMASQLDDPSKFSVAQVLIRVLNANRFPPTFDRTTYKGFIIHSSSPASIVSTYGNQVLLLQASDPDFKDAVNPNIRYQLLPSSAADGLYHVTQGGFLIARTDRLHAFDRHVLQVVARDEESGEEAAASVDIEVLRRGQTVPPGDLAEEQPLADTNARLLGGFAAIFLLLLLLLLGLVLLVQVSRRRRRDPGRPGAASPWKHQNPTASGRPESPFGAGAAAGRPGVYTRRHSLLPPAHAAGSAWRAGGQLLPVAEKAEE